MDETTPKKSGRGGRRPGAGRPKGSYKLSHKPERIKFCIQVDGDTAGAIYRLAHDIDKTPHGFLTHLVTSTVAVLDKARLEEIAENNNLDKVTDQN